MWGDITSDIYTIKGFSSILLIRRSSAVGPTGVYTCVIPDAEGFLRTLSFRVTGSKFYGYLLSYCSAFPLPLLKLLEQYFRSLAKSSD